MSHYRVFGRNWAILSFRPFLVILGHILGHILLADFGDFRKILIFCQFFEF